MNTMLMILTTVVFLLCAIAFFYYIFSFWCLWRFFSRPPEDKELKQPDSEPEPVSILKPVQKLSAIQLENIASFCVQDYPEYEIVIGTSVSEKEEFQALYSNLLECPLEVTYTAQNPGPNYKIGNLMTAASNARHKLLVLSDVDIWAAPDYLTDVVSCFGKKEAYVVTSLYRIVNITGMCAAFQALGVHGDFIPNVLVAEKIGRLNFAFGSGIAIHRNTLEAIGGLKSLLPYLADDYQIGYKAATLGYRVVIAPKLVNHTVNISSWKELWRQQLRWSVTYRVCRPVGYFFSFLTHGVSLASFNVLCSGFSLNSLVVWCLMVGVRYGTFFAANRLWLKNKELTRYIWFAPLKDLFSTVIWAASFLTKKVFWAGRHFRVNRDGTFTEIK
ncbi:MAG TPA: glycosyltransferase [Thermodesulfovibrionia bacterium]|nr:glycosyltransferase [Thermodesulfovibrionia bacterium]